MSWYTDPQLFIQRYLCNFYVHRITKEYGTGPISRNDLGEIEDLNFSKHLSLGNNKETDFDTFKASFCQPGIPKFINCQGFVILWDYDKQTGNWSCEQPNSLFWSLPGIITPQKSVTEVALERKVDELEEKISTLVEENKKIKKEKEAVEAENAILKTEVKKVSDLTSKLVQR